MSAETATSAAVVHGTATSPNHKDKYKSILSRAPLKGTTEHELTFKKRKRGWNPASVVRAVTEIDGNTVEVSSTAVPAPKVVRMGWIEIAIPNLADKNGWPVFAFPAQPVEISASSAGTTTEASGREE